MGFLCVRLRVESGGGLVDNFLGRMRRLCVETRRLSNGRKKTEQRRTAGRESVGAASLSCGGGWEIRVVMSAL